MTASKIFLYFCLSFIGGIFLSSFFEISQLLMLSFLILGILLISVFWQYKKIVVIGFLILFLVLGIWRYQLAEAKIEKNELKKYIDSKENITLVGILFKEPEQREKTQKLYLQVEEVEGNSLEAKILVNSRLYPQYQYGDKLKITGQLESPPVFEGFNYQDYLKPKGIFSLINFPKIELVGNFGNPIMKSLFSFKNKFKEEARNFISPPQEGILEALIFGEEERISSQWKEKLNFTGTRHITAVSGMNVTILAFLILNFLLLFGFWRGQAFYLSIFLLSLYILMIGAPASAVRAAIMGSLLMAGQHLGRFSLASRAIVFTASLMLFFNPFLLRYDVGFQLSFLATLGLIFLQNNFSLWFKKIPNSHFFPLRTTLSATISAQVFTLPILLYNFGYLPLFSPISNLLIVPFLAPITILIFIFGLSAIFLWPLAYIFSFPVWLSLTYITKIVQFFSQFPFSSLHFKISWLWLILAYLILFFLTWRLKEKEKLKFLQY